MGSDTAGSVAAVVEALKKLRGLRKLRVECIDGDARRVQLSTSRKKWAELRDTLAKLDWLRIEAQDGRGSVLRVFENEDADELADESPLELADADARVIELSRRMVALTLDAQDKALQRQTQHMNGLLESAVKLNRVMADRLLVVERLLEKRIKRMDELAELASAGEDGDGELMSGQMLAQLLPALPQLLPLITAKKPPTGGEG